MTTQRALHFKDFHIKEAPIAESELPKNIVSIESVRPLYKTHDAHGISADYSFGLEYIRIWYFAEIEIPKVQRKWRTCEETDVVSVIDCP